MLELRLAKDVSDVTKDTHFSATWLAYVITFSIKSSVDFSLSRLLRSSRSLGCRYGHFNISRSRAGLVVLPVCVLRLGSF